MVYHFRDGRVWILERTEWEEFAYGTGELEEVGVGVAAEGGCWQWDAVAIRDWQLVLVICGSVVQSAAWVCYDSSLHDLISKVLILPR